MGEPNYITDDKGNIVYPRTLAKCVKKGGTTLDDYLDKVEDATLIKPTVQGTDIQLQDASDMNIQELHLYGHTEQISTTGANLFDVNDKLLFNSIFEVDEEGYIVATIPANDTETAKQYIFYTNVNDILETNKEYLIVTEVKSIPANTVIRTISTYSDNYKSQFRTATVNSAKGTFFNKASTLNDFQNCTTECRGHIQIEAGSAGGKIEFRISILKDATITANTFKYEPYTGGMPSPNPDYPQEIVSVENPSINISENNDAIQTVTFNYELNAIDDVKDELIVKADGTGQFVQRINKSSLDDKSNFAKWYETTNTYGFEVYDSNCAFYSSKINIIADKLQGKTIDILNSDVYNSNGIAISTDGKIKIKILKEYLAEYSADAFKEFLKNNTIKILTILAEPIVTDLTAEEVQQVLALNTYKNVTNIWNDQNAEMQITYVADTKKYIDDKFEELSNAILASASEAE